MGAQLKNPNPNPQPARILSEVHKFTHKHGNRPHRPLRSLSFPVLPLSPPLTGCTVRPNSGLLHRQQCTLTLTFPFSPRKKRLTNSTLAVTEQVCNQMLALRTACLHPTTQKPYMLSARGGRDCSNEGHQVFKPLICSPFSHPILVRPQMFLRSTFRSYDIT